jgi:hydrogenase maturation protein HypF
MRYEGQAAMELEYIVGDIKTDESYSFDFMDRDGVIGVNWEQMMRRIIEEYRNTLAPGIIALKFHNSLAEVIVAIAQKAGQEKVVLSGGCFQNRYLLERCVQRLEKAGFRPYWHQRIPPNDGGIALGQVMAAIRSQNVSGNTGKNN